MSVLSRRGQGAFCGRLRCGMQEGLERHSASRHGSPASSQQTGGHGPAGAPGHRGEGGWNVFIGDPMENFSDLCLILTFPYQSQNVIISEKNIFFLRLSPSFH